MPSCSKKTVDLTFLKFSYNLTSVLFLVLRVKFFFCFFIISSNLNISISDLKSVLDEKISM